MPIEAWKYNARYPVARLFHMRLDFGGFLPMVARDAYADGRDTRVAQLGVNRGGPG